MIATKNSKERRIFFPWEGRGSLRAFFVRGRFTTIVSVVMVVTSVSWVVARERREAGERRTRVALSRVRPLVERYLLENDGACPASWAQLKQELSISELPVDGWGRPLRLECPCTRPGQRYVLMSDGPDGKPGGLDRIED